MSTIVYILAAGTVLGIVYYKIVSFLDTKDVLKLLNEQKKKELKDISDQVKLLKEVDEKKEKTYDEAKADYYKRYYSDDDGGSNS